MPWTRKQIRYFFAQANRGEISHAEARRRANEGIRPSVNARKSHGSRKSKKRR